MKNKKIRKLVLCLLCLPSTIFNKILFRLNRVHYGNGMRVYGHIWVRNKGTFILGNNVRIRSSATSNPIGCGNRCYFQILPQGKLIVGNNVALSNIAITCAQYIYIDNDVMIGSGVKIYDTDFHSLDANIRCGYIDIEDKGKTKPIYIGKRCFIGAGAFILKGVTIGEESIIGAGSVLTNNVPPREIWAGNPAKFIKKNC